MAIRIRTPIDPNEPGVLAILQDGAFFRLVKLRDNASFQLEPLAQSSTSHITKLEEENKRLKGLLRETEHRLNQEKRNAQGGRIKNPLQLRSRCNSHPDILHGNYTDSLLGQEMSVSCCMDTPTPSEQSDDTEYSENCPLTPISVASDGPPSDDECFLLSCTLCLKKMSVGELESHSRVCSATISSPTSMTRPSDSLLIAVSKVSSQQLLRVTTRTSRSDFPQQQCDVVRSAEDIQLLHDSLLEECPNCVIPPIVRQSHSHFSQQTEFQRFLARVAAHETLKSHDLLRKFLTASDHGMACWREEFFAKQQMNRVQARARRPAQQNNEDGALQHAKEYLSSLESNLRGLAKHLQKQRAVGQKDSASHWFQAIAKGEPRTTYLRTVCHGLARVCDDICKQQDDVDEQSVVQDLYSIIAYVHSAQALLARVHMTIDEYLYWDEEVKVFEMAGVECPVEYELQRTDSVSSVSSNSSTTSMGDVKKVNTLGQTSSSGTLRWAEANASCVSAKDRVEMMCNGLANELAHFDLRKETELKQFLLEFADNKLEVCDKMQSKWQAGRMLLNSPIEPPQRAIQLDIDIDENGGSGW